MDILRKYFTGQLSPQEENQVREWLLENSDDPEVVQALETIMNEFMSEDSQMSKEAFKDVCARLGVGLGLGRRRRLVRKAFCWISRVAACVVLLLAGALSYKYLFPDEIVQWRELKVPVGQIGELQLADGTVLQLNAGSRVTYPTEFIGNERRIFIEGEIYAEVSSDSEKPFIIETGDVDVKVLGTTFNFKSYDNTECVELLLLEGAVEVDIDINGKNRQMNLQPDEMIQYDRKTGHVDINTFNPFSFRSFHENKSIHFFNLRLSDIMSDLERLFGTKLILLDESLADTRYFALFTNNESLDQILNGVNIEGKMKFIRKDGVIYISKK